MDTSSPNGNSLPALPPSPHICGLILARSSSKKPSLPKYHHHHYHPSHHHHHHQGRKQRNTFEELGSTWKSSSPLVGSWGGARIWSVLLWWYIQYQLPHRNELFTATLYKNKIYDIRPMPNLGKKSEYIYELCSNKILKHTNQANLTQPGCRPTTPLSRSALSPVVPGSSREVFWFWWLW